MRRRFKWILSVSLCVSPSLLLPERAVCDEPDFQPVSDFLQLPDSVKLGKCSAVAIGKDGELFLFHRGKQPIICCDSDGKFIRSWGDDLIGTAHGLRVDPDGNVWATDIGHHMVFKFTPAGKLLLALGQVDKPGDARDQFNKPTDVAFGPKGEVFVSDGYGNNRVVKFDRSGRFLAQWGTAGKGPSEFDLPHSIVVDAKNRVIVGDRENDRIQVFDLAGRHLATWPGFAPYGIDLDKKQRVFVADGRAQQIVRLDATGKVAARFGKKGSKPGEFNLPHMLAVDADGNLYVAEVGGERFQKLRLPDAR
jgi:DNA-binding beta-propeller fold protein YncE